MTRIKKLTLAALTALALVGGAVSAAPTLELAKSTPKLMRETPADVAGDPSQWLRAAEEVAGQDPEVPVSPNFLAGKDPEFPVTSNQA